MKAVLAVIKTLGLALAFPLVLVLGALIGAVFGYNKANEWHYVKDGKPKDNEFVLIYTNLKNIYVGRIPTERDYFIVGRGMFVPISTVIAWCEIPQYKEK